MSDNDNKSDFLNLQNTELYICQDKFISFCENKDKNVDMSSVKQQRKLKRLNGAVKFSAFTTGTVTHTVPFIHYKSLKSA